MYFSSSSNYYLLNLNVTPNLSDLFSSWEHNMFLSIRSQQRSSVVLDPIDFSYVEKMTVNIFNISYVMHSRTLGLELREEE